MLEYFRKKKKNYPHGFYYYDKMHIPLRPNIVNYCFIDICFKKIDIFYY